MLYSAIAQGFLLSLLAIATLVAIRGDGWSRLSILLHVANYLLVSAFLDHRPHAFQSTDLCIDSVGAALAVVIAVWSGRVWAAALAAFQLLGVCTYFVRLLEPSVTRQVYQASFYVWEAGAQACLAWSAFARPSITTTGTRS